MPAPLSLERLRRHLAGRGLPSNYVERVIGEWADHLEDLSTAQFSKEAEMPQTISLSALGDEQELADATVLHYWSRTFAGRHPVWTFLIAPIPLLLVCWLAYYAGIVLFVTAMGEDFLHRQSPTQHAIVQFLLETGLQLPPIAATALLAWLAHRSGHPLRWFMAACTLVAILAACHHATFALPIGRGKGMLAIGFGIGANVHALQALAPLLTGALLMWWYGRHPVFPGGSTPETVPSDPLRQAA